MHTTDLPPLDEFVDIHALQPSVRQFFPTEQSIRWYLRRNRAVLVENGALISVAGRLLFHPARFKAAAVSIGLQSAA